MTLTREQVEKRKAKAERDLAHHKQFENHSNTELRIGSKAFIEHAEKEIALCDLALVGMDMQPRPLRNIAGRIAVITRLDRNTDEPYYIIVHKHIDGRWREAGADISCGHFNDNEPAIPLPEPKP